MSDIQESVELLVRKHGFAAGRGASRTAISVAESMLELSLPESLREFYLTCGILYFVIPAFLPSWLYYPQTSSVTLQLLIWLTFMICWFGAWKMCQTSRQRITIRTLFLITFLAAAWLWYWGTGSSPKYIAVFPNRPLEIPQFISPEHVIASKQTVPFERAICYLDYPADGEGFYADEQGYFRCGGMVIFLDAYSCNGPLPMYSRIAGKIGGGRDSYPEKAAFVVPYSTRWFFQGVRVFLIDTLFLVLFSSILLVLLHCGLLFSSEKN